MASTYTLADTGETVIGETIGERGEYGEVVKRVVWSQPFFTLHRWESMQGFNDSNPEPISFSSICAARELGDAWALSAPWLRHSQITQHGHDVDWRNEFTNRNIQEEGRPLKRERK